jgi:hypothetical protein
MLTERLIAVFVDTISVTLADRACTPVHVMKIETFISLRTVGRERCEPFPGKLHVDLSGSARRLVLTLIVAKSELRCPDN